MDREWLERLLAGQAAQADATGDMEFLGYSYPHAKQQRHPEPMPRGGPPRQPDLMEWSRIVGDPSSHPMFNPEVLPANLWNYGVGAMVGRTPQEWNPDLRMGDMLRGYGLEGWKNVAAQLGLGIIEPGPGDFAKWAPAIAGGLAAAIPRSLLSAFEEALAKSSGGRFDRTTRFFHGTPIPTRGQLRASEYGDYGRGLYFTDDAFEADGYSEGLTKATRNIPDPAPNVHAFYATGRLLHKNDIIPEAEAERLLKQLQANPVWQRARGRLLRATELEHDLAYRHDLRYGDFYEEARVTFEDVIDFEGQNRVHAQFEPILESLDPDDYRFDSYMTEFRDELRKLRGVGRNELNNFLQDAGFDGAWFGDEGILFNPAKSIVYPWDAPAMLRVVEESGVVSPEELNRLAAEVDRWLRPVDLTKAIGWP